LCSLFRTERQAHGTLLNKHVGDTNHVFVFLFELVHDVCCLQKLIFFFFFSSPIQLEHTLVFHILKLPVNVLFLLLFNRNHIPQILDLIFICTRDQEELPSDGIRDSISEEGLILNVEGKLRTLHCECTSLVTCSNLLPNMSM
jgi:hypothetical protein